MSEAQQRRVIAPLAAAVPEIGRWLWALEDTRRRTRETLGRVAQAQLDWPPPGGGNSIGTLLYHLALIEADYLAIDVLGLPDWPEELLRHFPHPDRDDQGRLTVVRATALEAHLTRLALVRERLLATFAVLTPDGFRRPRALPSYTISPEWTLHHLMQHEAEHRGEIAMLRDLAARAGV